MANEKDISFRTYFQNIVLKGIVLGFITGAAHLITLNLLKRRFQITYN